MAVQSGVTILNKYRIVKLLGEGGMARVLLAEELTFGKRLVALKEPRPNPLSDDAAEIALRYQREVQVCAELEQAGVPQIVRAITAEPYEDGLLLVMAYMPGGDLAHLIKQHPVGLPHQERTRRSLKRPRLPLRPLALMLAYWFLEFLERGSLKGEACLCRRKLAQTDPSTLLSCKSQTTKSNSCHFCQVD